MLLQMPNPIGEISFFCPAILSVVKSANTDVIELSEAALNCQIYTLLMPNPIEGKYFYLWVTTLSGLYLTMDQTVPHQ